MKRTIILTFLFFILNNSIIYSQPSIEAESAILIDIESKRILFEKDAYKKLPMASTTKIMTALVALENGDKQDVVEIDSESVGIEGSSIYLKEGEKISLEDLLYGLMLRSGNDAAMAIAKHIGGSVDRFVYLMNEKAKQIGANNTNFKNPHGLHHEEHYTTAYDLALITSKAMELEEFKQISKAKSWTANREENFLFYNKNKTLWEYEGGDGVKIGYTKKAGRCLVASATREDIQLIAVVLNDNNWFEDCYELLDYGFENYKSYVIFKRGEFIKNVPVIYGDKKEIKAITEENFRYLLAEDELKDIKVDYSISDNLKAPISKGDIVGEIKVYFKGRLIYKGNIISADDVEEINLFKKLIEKIKNIF